MKINQLLEVIQACSTKELNDFTNYLQPPFFNKKAQVVALFEQLSFYSFDPDQKTIDKGKLHQLLFPEKSYSPKRMNRLMDELLEHLLNFLAIQAIKTDEMAMSKWKIKALGKKGLPWLLHNEQAQFEQRVHQSKHLDTEYYRYTMDVYHEVFFCVPPAYRSGVKVDVHQLMEHLDDHYILSKLSYSCLLYSRKAIIRDDLHIPLLKEIKELVNQTYPKQNPLFFLYHQILEGHIRKSFTSSNFNQLIDYFKKHKDLLPLVEQQNVFTHLINLAYGQMNQSEGKIFTGLIFDLYQYGDDLGLLLNFGKMTDVKFSNIVVTGCLLKKFSWVEQFIKNNQTFLPEPIKNNATVLSWAYCYFHQKEFHKAGEQLNGIRFMNPSYTLRGRSLMVRSQFEMYLQNASYYETVKSGIESFKRLLYRYKKNKISWDKAVLYLNQLKVINQLLDHRLKGKSKLKNKKQTLDLIDKNKPIVALSWLEEKVKELYN